VKTHVGQAIIITNVSRIVHTVVAANNAFESGDIRIGGAWTFTAKKVGAFPFHCIYHPGMMGTITVTR
jgi:plastocyanin